MNDDISANTRQTSPDTTCTGSMGVCARARAHPTNQHSSIGIQISPAVYYLQLMN